MDLLIEKDNERLKLSELGLTVVDVEDSSPSIILDRRTVTNRSGVVLSGGQYGDKTISARGHFVVADVSMYEQLKTELNGLLVDIEPYYINRLIQSGSILYEFEIPGEKTGDIDFHSIEHIEQKYRYFVTNNGPLSFSFIGKSDEGLHFEFTFEFITARLPFGETVPYDRMVSGNFTYEGTAKNSQLEYPWLLELTSYGGSGQFFVEMNGRRFEFNRQTPLQSGDVIRISGIETRQNQANVNHYTNNEHFILKPGQNTLTTNFNGTMTIIDYVELYK